MKKLVSFMLAVAMLVGLMITPAFAAKHECYANGEATVTLKGAIGTTYNSYRYRDDAEYHQFTIYADEGDFPITVQIHPYGGEKTTREIASYGIHHIFWENFWRAGSWLVVMIKHPSEKPEATTQSTPPKQPTEDEILERKTKTLIRALDLPCSYYSIDSCVYTKEIKAFLSGEWDGSRRSEDNNSSYSATRYVTSRTYYWIGNNLWTSKSYNLHASVDYNGYKEVIPGRTTSQDYSLAVSRLNGEIEKWSLFEKQDAWKIEPVANGYEQIKSIVPLARNDSAQDACQVFVTTTDADDTQHMYSLMPDGEVIKIV